MAIYKTTVLSSGAFLNNKMLKTVVAKGILSVEDEAFEGCTNVTTVNISDCVYIGDNAFNNCTSLTQINSTNTKTIGNFAFKSCSGLENIDTNAVEVIGNDAFRENKKLSSYYFPNCLSIGDNAFYLTIDGNTNKSNMYFPRCEYIGEYAFYCQYDYQNKYLFNDMTVIDFPACKKIGKGAFKRYKTDSNGSYYSYMFQNVSALNFPNCLEIGDEAFRERSYRDLIGSTYTWKYCSLFTNLTSIYFPVCQKIGLSAFQHCTYDDLYNSTDPRKLLEINFPECKEIGAYAFNELRYSSDESYRFTNKVSSILFPNCEYIGNNAFDNFYTDKEVDLNLSNCLSVMDYAFYNSNMMSSINLSKCKYIGNYTFSNSTQTFTDITLPNIERIGDNNFDTLKDSNLTSISFGPKLSYIGIRNFNGMTNNDNITLSIDENNPYFTADQNTNAIYSSADTDENGKGLIDFRLAKKGTTIDDDIDYIRYYAAYGCSNISSIGSKSNKCKTIGHNAFESCNNLVTLVDYEETEAKSCFPNCEYIGDHAFYNDTSLTGSIYFPNCLSVGSYAFANNSSSTTENIYTISLPKCTNIGSYAFYGSRKPYPITQIYIPECSSIGEYAFSEIASPTDCTVTLGRTVPTLVGSLTRLTCYFPQNIKFYVPESLSAEYWSKFGSIASEITYYPDDKLNWPSYAGYYYKKDEPTEDQATIFEMTDISKATITDSVIPEEIVED